MPSDPDGTFSISVTLRSARRAELLLSGDVDLPARQPLADAVDQLAAAAPDHIVVNLAAVTFAGATLVNFLASVRAAVPPRSVLVACRPAPLVHFVLRMTDAAQIATIHLDTCVCSNQRQSADSFPALAG